jgi:hypothetical protein
MGTFVEREGGVITRIVPACEGIGNTSEKFEGARELVRKCDVAAMSLAATAKSFGELTENIATNSCTHSVQPTRFHENEIALARM